MPFEDLVGTEATLNNMVDIVALKNCRPHLPNRATDNEVGKLTSHSGSIY